jgi:hypothetical protein
MQRIVAISIALLGALAVAALVFLGFPVASVSKRPDASQQSDDRMARFKRMSEDAERRGLAEPFRGIATSSGIEPGLFAIRSSGVSTEPVRKSAAAFLASLSDAQRQHIHAVVRTPNGNDYGKDLLRQHYLQYPHPH